MSGGFFTGWTIHSTKLNLGLATPIDPAKTRLILCNNATWTSNSSEAAVFSSEVKEANGYQRFNVTVDDQAIAYDPTTRRVKAPTVTWSFTPTEEIYWNAIALVGNSTSTANKTVTDIDLSTGIFTLPDHGLSSGSKVTFSISENGSLPGQISSGAAYFAINTTGSTFQIASTIGGNPIVPTSNKSGVLTCHYADGIVISGHKADSLQVVPANTPFEAALDLSFFNTNLGTGVNW